MKTIFLTLLAFVTFSLHAQKHQLGKVTIDELKQSSHPLDPDAPAAILFEKGNSRIEYNHTHGFMLLTDIDVKIKIYTKEGLAYANKKIPFYATSSTKETVNISKAFTYNLVNDKIEKTKLNNDGQFIDVLSEFWSEKRIAMPNVREGAIVEYSISVVSPLLDRVPEWSFQKGIPVDYSEFIFTTPGYYNYNFLYKGYLTPEVETYTSNKRVGIVSNHTYGSKIQSKQYLDFTETTKKYILQNIPSLNDESFVSNIDNYRAQVVHELAVINMPNSLPKYLTTTWDEVAKTIYNNESFKTELNRDVYFEDDLKVILSKYNTNSERLLAIFRFVQSKMNWNEYLGVYTDKGVRRAYKDNTGNIAEINFILAAMLRKANINANPVLLSTRSKGVPLFPSRKVLNYVIVAVDAGDQTILLDASNKNTSPNIIPINTINWNGLIVYKNENTGTVPLTPNTSSNSLVNLMCTLDEHGVFTGKQRTQMQDYYAFIFKENYLKLVDESNIDRLEKKYQDIEITAYKTTASDDVSKPIVEEYSFIKDGSVEHIGDKMYFSPMLGHGITTNPFKVSKREYPIDFIFPRQEKFNFSIAIPEGYEVETLPESTKLIFEEGIIDYTYQISQRGANIQLAVSFNINQAVVLPKYYDQMKDFFENLVKKTTEKVVLKKI